MLNQLMTLIQMNLSSLTRDERGVTLLEYAAIAFLILLVALAAITLVGTNITNVWNQIAGALPGGGS